MRSTRKHAKGFTLVEILIVVIILGILAAIVIPTFSNASGDARKSSLLSQLQTLKSQVELYKLQHKDRYPTTDGTLNTAWNWDLLTTTTDSTGAVATTTESFGPYLPAKMINPVVSDANVDATNMAIESSELSIPTGSAMPGIASPGGWTITPSGRIYAAGKSGTHAFDEITPGNPQNDQ